MPSPTSVLRAWFAAHAAGDMEAARTLLAAGAAVTVPDAELFGFDAFMDWYATRRSALQNFRYEVLDTLGGERHAAAVLRLTDGSRAWRQVAVYEIAEGQIISMTLYEDAPSDWATRSPTHVPYMTGWERRDEPLLQRWIANRRPG